MSGYEYGAQLVSAMKLANANADECEKLEAERDTLAKRVEELTAQRDSAFDTANTARALMSRVEELEKLLGEWGRASLAERIARSSDDEFTTRLRVCMADEQRTRMAVQAIAEEVYERIARTRATS